MKKQTSTQSIYKRFKQFIILGTVAILTVCTTATASESAPNFETMEQSAQQGDATAQVFLGYMYYRGDGVKQDHKKAVAYLTQSAENGNAYAQYFLGNMYETGGRRKTGFIPSIYILF